MTTSSVFPAREAASTPRPTPFPWVGLIALAATVFLSVSSEMIPTGLLPEMSASLDVTPSQVGLLVTFFAFTVVISSAPLTAATVKLPRHALMVGILLVLGLSNLLTALSPTYELVVASRVLGGLAHGLFWALVPAYAAHLVPKEQIARAVSITLGGGTLAFVLGVPLGTVLGQSIGWRWAFAAIAIAFGLGALAVLRWLPKVDRVTHAARSESEPRRDPTVLPVVAICVTTAIVMIGHYALYTFIAPFVTDSMRIAPEYLSAALFIYGGAGAVGLILTGTVFAKRTSLGLILALATTAVSVTVMALFTSTLWLSGLALVVWGLAFGLIAPLLQTRMLHTASPRIRDTASAFYTTAFNAGIGGGALVGSLLLDWKGVNVLPVADVALTLLGLVIIVATIRLSKRSRSRSESVRV
ncbi:MFS transporter [Mycetocola zhadangensis]|uniref:MFS transporter n=1 Tax=Mycetocola zhadangensis TaxID=1164595 RepID=A0A3L7J4G2_9MICO|nr:MFS transporter [Mycetocola zhadangensis]RLQ85483.1 MFS transporter [Mycetocola zhadangensis]GGE82989.1 putative sugar efflux transporter [Mycetocola zhadangensis]